MLASATVVSGTNRQRSRAPWMTIAPMTTRALVASVKWLIR